MSCTVTYFLHWDPTHPLQGQNYSSKKKCKVHNCCASDKIHAPRGGAKHNMPMDAVTFYVLAFSRGFYCLGVIFYSLLLSKKTGLDTHISEQSLAYLRATFLLWFTHARQSSAGNRSVHIQSLGPWALLLETEDTPQHKLSALGQGDLFSQVPALSAWSTAIGSLPMQPDK